MKHTRANLLSQPDSSPIDRHTHRQEIRTQARAVMQDDNFDPEIGGIVLNISSRTPAESFFNIQHMLSQAEYDRCVKALRLVLPIASSVVIINSFRLLGNAMMGKIMGPGEMTLSMALCLSTMIGGMVLKNSKSNN